MVRNVKSGGREEKGSRRRASVREGGGIRCRVVRRWDSAVGELRAR